METATASEARVQGRRRLSVRVISYWTFTLFIAGEMVAGSMWDLLRIPFVRAVFDQLGYPHYLSLILGVWKLPCAVALIVPRFPTLKEWAYAGAVFTYTGAVASHMLSHDGPSKWLGPSIFAAITFASWALRPDDRKMVHGTPPPPISPRAWVASFGAIAAFIVIALLTLPKGVPAQ
jgi:hypothetical protein